MTTRTAIGCGRPEAAVTALELGRALVLHAASAATGVPELLAARGHRELADAWRKETAAPHTEGGRILPGSLRRQALEALGYRQHDSRTTLFATPSTAALRAGSRRATPTYWSICCPDRARPTGWRSPCGRTGAGDARPAVAARHTERPAGGVPEHRGGPFPDGW